jgi:osmotically-inducible protein OsmY
MQRILSLSTAAMLIISLTQTQAAPQISESSTSRDSVQAKHRTVRESSTVEAIREALLRLPYYGVFDFLAFTYEKGVVTLSGYDYRGTLKEDAERAVRRVPGVDEVGNQIEILPLSPHDDELRWRAFYAIYSDPFLSRYAPGGGVLWGHRHRVRPGMWPQFGSRSTFLGMQPVGDYPISIIVKSGRITLLGLVDSEADKTMAGFRAREVPGSFEVDNQLMVEDSE